MLATGRVFGQSKPWCPSAGCKQASLHLGTFYVLVITVKFVKFFFDKSSCSSFWTSLLKTCPPQINPQVKTVKKKKKIGKESVRVWSQLSKESLLPKGKRNKWFMIWVISVSAVIVSLDINCQNIWQGKSACVERALKESFLPKGYTCPIHPT